MKMKLEDLKVQSFITRTDQSERVAGGAEYGLHSVNPVCPTSPLICDTIPEVCNSYVHRCEITDPPLCIQTGV